MTTTSMKNPMTQQQADVDEPTESFRIANTLVLLSRSNNGRDRNQRTFECKTCNRQFSSFQALGGHRASHRKTRYNASKETHAPPESAKPRIHECSICGLEFPLGQALGGHMRRHRASSGHHSSVNVSRRVVPGLNLDLNLAPPDSDADANKDWQDQGIDYLELQLDLAEKVRFVEWLH